jgi:hypothetical protein
MGDKIAARLEDYVRNGGHLFADFETSLYDETGVRRNDFALAPAFGAVASKKIAGPRRWDFMQPVSDNVLLAGLKREFIPSPVYYVPVAPKSGSVVLKYTEPLAGRYDGVPKLSNDPALLMNKLGKGRVVYFSGDIGNTIETFHTPELIELLGNTARHMSTGPVTLKNAPGSVEMVVRTQNNGRRTLVHLVNFTGEMTRPIRHIVPLSDVQVTLPRGVQAAKAYTLWDRRPVALTRDQSGSIEAVVPRLNEYEVLVFEK